MVDGIALASAAAVAHCDPVRCGAYDSRNKSSPYLYFPTLVIIRAPKSSEEKIQGIAAAVESHGSFDRFCYQFAVALHLLFSLRSDGHVYAANYLRSAISSLAVKGSGTTTVTTVGVFAPYFFIEPTTILPKDVFGFAAETEGFAALVTPGEGAKMPFFERAEPVAKCRHVSEWILTYRSARTCGMVLFAMNSGEDGLDEMQIRDFDHDMFVLTRLSHEEMLRRKRNRGFVTPADLLWVRGLSKLPHPAEMIQGCGRLRMTLVHRDLKHGRESRPTPYIPDPDDAQLAELTLNASKPAFCCCGKSDQKSRGVSRIITCGATKLEQSLLGRR
ncbi:uncharacterized protein EMH_0095820 [Eimeria mitis]|uniref:Uncharacterized protein n=1 Tax=Eimeria mitis TaxID=44415 RepID=U6KKH3_9EIME|nr:uncharacterized protein EMH_0095820 [Eimeria mitis]CDJ36777.1 hypothetical protein, conserved [Eimeria mitis]